MSNERLSVVKSAWQSLAKGQGCIPFEVLVGKYNAPAHPRVTSREKKAETVMSDFVSIMGEKCDANGGITEEAFCSYYMDINAVLPADKESYFIDTVLKTWGVQGGANVVSANRCQEIEDIIFEKIR